MNVLNAMPKSVQGPRRRRTCNDIWQADTKAEANAAFDFFVKAYGVKWDKAVAKLVKDRDALLTFYDFPAEHWKHIPHVQPDREHVRHRENIERSAPRAASAARPASPWRSD